MAALSWGARLRGLLFRRPLARDGSEGMLISPCGSVHTFGMTYPIDVVFLDRAGTVLRVCESLRPWRSAMQRGARSVIEFHGGAARLHSIKAGDVIAWK
ncbi:DUF192 domain-containing protein [Lysobacter spongiae]|uniref:DUF192 domain-containing protein n=2 Tax=Marilutibacter spongiae TaxID=2025720 RepID=A0A7W3Y7I6_9GAMM|nr:DUF192 domain-containing protein [Lysobacter spongiae]MBB1061996.1 DUF192 domain-containing protein [Lysobacter spongiae]